MDENDSMAFSGTLLCCTVLKLSFNMWTEQDSGIF